MTAQFRAQDRRGGSGLTFVEQPGGLLSTLYKEGYVQWTEEEREIDESMCNPWMEPMLGKVRCFAIIQ